MAALITAAVLLGCIVVLVSGYLAAKRRDPIDKQRVEQLQRMVKKEAKHAPELAAELERQTQESMRREARNERVTRLLITSGVLFLLCAKWLVWLAGPRLPRPVQRGAVSATSPTPPYPSTAEVKSEEPGLPDWGVVDEIIQEQGRHSEATIPILQAIQSRYGYVPDGALKRVCERTEITPAQVIGVLTFYPQFRRRPMGRHLIKVCHGTACHVAGAVQVTEAIRRSLGMAPDAHTDPQRLFTVEEVACLGCCTLAPVIQIDGVTYGHLSPDRVPEVLRDFLAAGKEGVSKLAKARAFSAQGVQGELRIGLGSCCMAGGSAKVRSALEQAIEAAGVNVTVKRVGCVGMCHQTPLVQAILPDGTSATYGKVGPQDTRAIVLRHFKAKGVARQVRNRIALLLNEALADKSRPPITRHAIEVRDPPVAAFLDRQHHIATEHCGRIDPIDLDEYLAHDGFSALRRCLNEVPPEEVIDQVHRSGLRGRGGAGYTTGLKWSSVRSANGDRKYVICNGDEGDPGAFMDRMLMESYPYRIIEGLAIAAHAIGADEGYFYIRAEYPLAVERIGAAIARCEERGFLGDNLLGTGRRLRLHIKQGAGAFVCGEETAMLASIEGRRGMPRLRPPYPAESGLWGRPTLVNNVETCAVVPWIIRHGPEAFARLGVGQSKGTKVFALAGKVARGGLIEVPMGMTLRQIVEDIGGGVRAGRRFKAVQVGGPSGGCIPAELADTPVDYEALTEIGAIMGSGGLVVLDDSDCMVEIARYFLRFTQNQSCGKCTFCRIGTRRMLEILDRLCAGEGRKGDLDQLEHLAQMVRKGSLCGLGKTAPNPVLTTLRYFRDEYEAHLNKRCPAARCRALITYSVTDDCIGCTLCAQHCPAGAIRFAPYEKHEIDASKCIRCGTCKAKCPVNAVKVE
jgi:NADH-quinone oxidoreductase subunit F